MDDFAAESWLTTEADDEDQVLSAEPGDPAVSAAIVAAAVLLLACTLFLVSGLPARLHAAVAHRPTPPASQLVRDRVRPTFF